MTINAFGKALRELRLARNLSQQDFVKVISREHVSRLERGVSQPNLEIVEALADVLQIQPLSLLTLSYQIGMEGNLTLEQLFSMVTSEIDVGKKHAEL